MKIKKRFYSFCLTIVMMITSLFPSSTVLAGEEVENESGSFVTVNVADLPVEEAPDDFIFPSAKELESMEKLGPTANTTSYDTYGVGRWYLGYFSFYNNNTGNIRTYVGSRMRVCIAWKSADSGGDVDLEVTVYQTSSGSYTWKKYRCADDGDGADSDGYYYLVGPWSNIYNFNQDRYIFYDAVTREGYTPPGYYRSAHVHTWVDVE